MDAGEEQKNQKTSQTFGEKVDQFVAELHEAADRLQTEFEEKFEELKVSAERMKKEAADRERWKEVERNLKKAGDELTNAFKAAFKKRD